MRRKLALLNVALLALTVYAGWRLREERRAARARAAAVLSQKPKAPAPPGLEPIPQSQPAVAAGYIDIAQKMLFSKDRNPVVVVETKPEPPPKPMPRLPVFHGVMNLGDGVSAVFSEKPDSPHREVQPGGTIGEFKLLSVDSRDVTFEWEGKKVTRSVAELAKPPAPEQQPAARTSAGTRTDSAAPAAPQPAGMPAASQTPGRPEPGADLGGGAKSCLAGDTSPAGTVVNGYKKMVFSTPFGGSGVCQWVAVK